MKKYIIYGLCVFTGIALAIGLSTTFAASPTVSPPGGNVTPTFSGLTVNDSATIKNLGVSNEFGVVGITTLIGDTKIIDGDLNVVENLDVGGVLDIEGSIKSTAQGVVLLDNNATVSKDLTVNGVSTFNGTSTLKDDLTVEGLVTLNSKVDVKGYLSSSDAEKDIDVQSKLNVQESIYNAGVNSLNQPESVIVDDNLEVTKDIYADGMITTQKNISAVGNIIATGDIKTTANLTADGYLIVDGDLTVGGKITTKLLGSYGEKISGKIYVAANSDNKADTPACNSEGMIIDCGMKNYRLANGSYTEVDYDFTVHSIYADKNTNKCTVKAKNTNTATRYLEAIAVCFYPSY